MDCWVVKRFASNEFLKLLKNNEIGERVKRVKRLNWITSTHSKTQWLRVTRCCHGRYWAIEENERYAQWKRWERKIVRQTEYVLTPFGRIKLWTETYDVRGNPKRTYFTDPNEFFPKDTTMKI